MVEIPAPDFDLAMTLDSGQELQYQKLLLATGGRNRRLHVAGAELPRIHYLRTVAECDLAVFDLTGFEPAVMLLLGVRAVVRRGVTICTYRGRVPFGELPPG